MLQNDLQNLIRGNFFERKCSFEYLHQSTSDGKTHPISCCFCSIRGSKKFFVFSKQLLESVQNSLLRVQDSPSLSSSIRRNSQSPSNRESLDDVSHRSAAKETLKVRATQFNDDRHEKQNIRSRSLSNNIGDLKCSAESFRKSFPKICHPCKNSEDQSFGSLEENLNSLDRTIKKCYLQLNRKLKREATPNYVPTASVPRFSCRPSCQVRTEKVIVFIRVVFLKIGEIDTMKENFTADAFIQARWREPALDGMTSQNPDDIDWSKFWNPKIYIENSYTDPKETIWQTIAFNSEEEATVLERRRIRGCFIENLELDEFPFDTQDLTLTITTERSETELELEEDTDEISSINVQSFVDEQEWKLHSHVETWKKITTKAYQNSKAKHPSFSTSCRATRRPGFFIWNIFLVMLFICSLTFATFCVDLMKPENRLQLSFILLLTTITFKFVVSQTLPRISYLTYLDKYILISMAILCAVCVWHALVFSYFRNDLELAKVVDRWALIISGSAYFLFHVFFFSTIYLVALKKRWKYDKKDKEHKERIKRLQRLQDLTKMKMYDEEENAQKNNPSAMF